MAEEEPPASAVHSVDDQEQARLLQEDYKKIFEETQASRKENLTASERWPDESSFRSLNSDVKKNVALVKKLRTSVFDAQKDALLADIRKQNLTKYIHEVVSSLAEASKLKKADVGCAVALTCYFHTKYSAFTAPFREAVLPLLTIPDPSDKEGISSFRFHVRFLVELVVVGVLPISDCKPIYEVLKKITNPKREDSFLAVVVSFIKQSGFKFIGIIPRRHRLLAEKHGFTIERVQILKPEQEKAFQTIFVEYFQMVSAKYVQDFKELKNNEFQNEVTIELKGELSEERKEATEKERKDFEKLSVNISTFADVLDLDVPVLPVEKPRAATRMKIDISNPYKDLDATASLLWEDEDTRCFYEQLTDLRASLPAALFGDKKDKNEEQVDEDIDTEVDNLDVDDEIDTTTTTTTTMTPVATASSTTTSTTNSSQQKQSKTQQDGAEYVPPEETADRDEPDQMSSIKVQLSNCINRDLVDQVAIAFCYMNNKVTRKSLANILFKVPRKRQDLIPYYARLVGTLHPVMRDVGDELVSQLEGEFRFFINKNIQTNIDSQIRNVRFLSELTKFKVCPAKTIINCLHLLIKRFSSLRIDLACAILECCGRFLFRSGNTHVRTKQILEVMMRKKVALPLDERQKTMIENALIYCNPPENKPLAKKTRPPLHDYARHLLYVQLNLETSADVLKKLRKLPWTNPEFEAYMLKCFTRPWMLKFHNIAALASLLSGLVYFYSSFGDKVMDATLEDIRVMMEINDPKFHRRRISAVKYLAEMYVFSLADSDLIFKVLFSLTSFGSNSNIDLPNDYFRIRLICTILDSCGEYFVQGMDKKRLDSFLVYFQRYCLNKRQPLPVDADISIDDTLNTIRPKLVRLKTFDDACAAVNAIERVHFANKPIASTASSTSVSVPLPVMPEIDLPVPEVIESKDEVPEGPDVQDMQFVEDFNKLMNETLHSRRNEAVRVQPLDVAIPMHLKGAAVTVEESEQPMMKFTLLTKKGAKPNQQSIAIPLDSPLATNVLEKKKIEKQEKDFNKKFVMGYAERVKEEERDQLALEMQQNVRTSRPSRAQASESSRRQAKDKDFIWNASGHL